jgi:hypothetical protein
MTASPLRPVGLCFVAVVAAGAAFAAPVDLDAIPKAAVWMMHLDMDAVRDSTVMRQAYERAARMHPHLEKMMQMAAGMAGMDPRRDLHGVTAYGLDTDKHNAVLVVRAKANREFLEKMVQKAPDHASVEHGRHTLHRWTHKGWKRSQGHPVVGAFFKDDVMVFARTEAQVKAALDVLDGDAAGTAADGRLAGRVRPGSILVARAAEVDPDTKCPVLKQGRSFRVAMGEHEGQSFYRARLDMKSGGAAEEVQNVVQGFASLVRLRWGDEAAAMKLLAGLEVDARGDTCMISWDAPAAGVWDVVEKAADAWEKRQRQWNRMRGGHGSCEHCGRDGCEACGEGRCPLQGKRGSAKDKDRGALRDDEF